MRTAESNQAVQSCLSAARREQLTSFVAPAASLYLTAPGGEAPAGFTLSPENKVRLFEVAGGILMLTLAVTVLGGIRLIRPLRALTGAAKRMCRTWRSPTPARCGCTPSRWTRRTCWLRSRRLRVRRASRSRSRHLPPSG